MAKTGVTSARVVPAALMVLAFLAVGAVLKLTVSVVLPLVIALLLSFVLSPVVDWLVRRKIPRLLAIIVVLLGILGFGYLVGLILYSSVSSLVRSWSTYQSRLLSLYYLVLRELGLPENLLGQPDVLRSIGSYALGFFGNFVRFFGSFLLVLVFLLFMLLEKRFFRRKMYRAIHGPRTDTVLRIFKHVNKQVGRYLTIKFVVSLAMGAGVWFAFRLIGVDFAFVWGALSFLFNFMPAIGSLIIGIVGTLFSVVQFYPNWTPVVETAAAIVVLQISLGSVLEPMLQGDNLNLSPLVVLFSLLIWGWLWGLMGMLLSIPLTVALKITLENIPGLEFFSILMGTGYPPRPPKRRRVP